MDDGILISHDKEYLKYCLAEISKFLDIYKLKLNVKKTRIDSIKNGIDFLGFKFYIKNNKIIMKVRNETKKKFKKKMKKINRLFDEKIISYDERKNVIDSYLGHLSYGNCNNLLGKYISCKSVSLGEEVSIDI